MWHCKINHYRSKSAKHVLDLYYVNLAFLSFNIADKIPKVIKKNLMSEFQFAPASHRFSMYSFLCLDFLSLKSSDLQIQTDTCILYILKFVIQNLAKINKASFLTYHAQFVLRLHGLLHLTEALVFAETYPMHENSKQEPFVDLIEQNPSFRNPDFSSKQCLPGKEHKVGTTFTNAFSKVSSQSSGVFVDGIGSRNASQIILVKKFNLMYNFNSWQIRYEVMDPILRFMSYTIQIASKCQS